MPYCFAFSRALLRYLLPRAVASAAGSSAFLGTSVWLRCAISAHLIIAARCCAAHAYQRGNAALWTRWRFICVQRRRVWLRLVYPIAAFCHQNHLLLHALRHAHRALACRLAITIAALLACIAAYVPPHRCAAHARPRFLCLPLSAYWARMLLTHMFARHCLLCVVDRFCAADAGYRDRRCRISASKCALKTEERRRRRRQTVLAGG